MNISVTNEQQGFVDSLVKKLGFANRSELFRTLIRRVSVNPEIIAEPKISKEAIKRYDKMVEDVRSGKAQTFKANSVNELLDHLHGRKNPVPSKLSEKLRKKN
jgi:Arc/MetJ-type ribon-helix-helix transcriptional regulator